MVDYTEDMIPKTFTRVILFGTILETKIDERVVKEKRLGRNYLQLRKLPEQKPEEKSSQKEIQSCSGKNCFGKERRE